MSFDPYHKWLGIPATEQPANHYRLLALALYEDDPDVIETAADQRMALLRTLQTGQHSALSQKLLNELAAARLCLLTPDAKAAYDAELRQKFQAAQTVALVLPTAEPVRFKPVSSQTPIGIAAEPRTFGGQGSRSSAAARRRSPNANRMRWQIAVFAASVAGMVVAGGLIYAFKSTRDREPEVVAHPSGVKAPIKKPPANMDKMDGKPLLAPSDRTGQQPVSRSPNAPVQSDPPPPSNNPAQDGTRPDTPTPVAAAPASHETKQATVALALDWLKRHQSADGSWSFNHTGGECHSQCGNPGRMIEARFAATGLAILPFLGAGQTHLQGKFKEQLRAALFWLASNMVETPNGGDMTAGGSQLSGHAIATIALCEANAMTHDPQLAGPAQSALKFIMYAQDPRVGGWGPSPRQLGDVAGVGWPLMALKSGSLGALHVDKPTIDRTVRFLDLKQTEGLFYADDHVSVRDAETAAGLLCRMYTGWGRDRQELGKGVRYLVGMGPDLRNMYFTYFATQLLHQYDGPDGEIFQSWNKKLRDSLIASQTLDTHARGSWIFRGSDEGFEQGGRLYCTAMATMALEVYYRYLPVYTQRSVQEPFIQADTKSAGDKTVAAASGLSAKSIPGLDDPAFQQWLNDVGGLPAEQLAAAVTEKLCELNRGLPAKGRVAYKIEQGIVSDVEISSPIVRNLLPLRALGQLKSLNYTATGVRGKPGVLADLLPLAGMSLTRLVCSHSQISDLSALRGMPLAHLDCSYTDVSDLSPLAGMPLTSLVCARTKVADLSALKDMALTNLDVSQTPVVDLSPLKGLPLAALNCSSTRVSDLSPLRGSPLQNLVFSNTQVSDLSPLEDMPMLRAFPLRGRGAGARAVLIGKYGGNRDTEAAVSLGLDWLARNQRKDGTWSLKGPYRSGATIDYDLPAAATAMALLAFEGAGNTHELGEFRKQVAAGMAAVLKMQGSDGSFFQAGGDNHRFYAHGQCTTAICELYGMTKEPQLKRPAELAVKFCVDSQDPSLGGWRYQPRNGSDTSVTGCILLALETARMAGLEVPATVLQRASDYLDKATPDGSRYSYEVRGGPTLALTAEALLCRQHLGWKRDDPRLVAGVDYLMQNLPRYEDRDVYYWYYGTRAMYNMQGKYWSAWSAALRDTLIRHQEKAGAEKGSWEPQGEHPDRWSNQGQGMRLYVTCFSIYMLEAYYRYLPIYAEDPNVGAKS